MSSKPSDSGLLSGDPRTRLFGSLCALVFMVNFGRVAFAPLLDTFRDVFGVGPGTVGVIATLAWLGSALPRIPTGYLLTRVPRHRVVLGTGLVLAGASAFTATVDSVAALGVGAFLVGVASGAYFIAANPLISELFPHRVGRVIGVHGTASQLAAVVAPLSIGALLIRAPAGEDSWRFVFWAMAAVALAVTALITVTSRRADLPDAGSADRHLLQAAVHQWRVILAGVVILGTAGFVWNGLFNFYVPYLTSTKGLSQATAQSMLTLVFAAGVPAFWFAGRLADRFPHVPLLLGVLGGFIVAVVALTFTAGLASVVAVTVVLGYVVHSLFPTMDTYLLDTLPDRHRASAYAAYSGAMMVIQATGSAVLGSFVDAGFAYDAVFRAFAGVLLVVLVGLLVLYRAGRLPDGGAA
ncbi:MFS transporter [Halobacteriaceae archaeon GCM10025711]